MMQKKIISKIHLGLVFFLVAVTIIVISSGIATSTEYISIGTGSMGGIYYPLGGGMANIITEYVEGYRATAEVTGASLENVQRIDAGEMEMGMTNVNIAYYAYYGKEPFEKKLNILGGFALYPSVLEIITIEGTGIETIRDFKDKIVSVGPPGSTTALMVDIILKQYDMSMEDIKPRYNSIAESVAALKDGNIDAAFILAGIPLGAITELNIRKDVVFVPLSSEALEGINQLHPYYVPGVVPAGTYEGIDEDVDVLTIANAVVFDPELKEEFVYEATKAIFENLDRLVAIHSVAKMINLEYAVEMPIPFHPGAEKYFKEQGVLMTK